MLFLLEQTGRPLQHHITCRDLRIPVVFQIKNEFEEKCFVITASMTVARQKDDCLQWRLEFLEQHSLHSHPGNLCACILSPEKYLVSQCAVAKDHKCIPDNIRWERNLLLHKRSKKTGHECDV